MIERLFAEDRVAFLERKIMLANQAVKDLTAEYNKLLEENNSLKKQLEELKKEKDKPARRAASTRVKKPTKTKKTGKVENAGTPDTD